MLWSELETDSVMSEMDIPLIVFHDEGDREVPWDAGAAIARRARRGRLVTTSGLGHVRILRDREVVEEAVDFLTAGHRQGGKLPDDIAVPDRTDRRGV